MPFDYKKEYKEFYMSKNKPSIVTVPGRLRVILTMLVKMTSIGFLNGRVCYL